MRRSVWLRSPPKANQASRGVDLRVAALLLRVAPFRFAIAIAIGIASGLCGAALIRVIKIALFSPSDWIALAFVSLLVSRLITGLVSDIVLHFVSNRTLADLRVRLCRAILETPFARVEELGAERLLGALTDDMEAIGEATVAMITIATSGATILGGLVYLAWLSPWLVLGVVVIAGIGVRIFKVFDDAGHRIVASAMAQRPIMIGAFSAVIQGAKELRLRSRQREGLLSETLEPAVFGIHKTTFHGTRLWHFAQAIELMTVFVILGGLLFAVPRFTSVGDDVITSYVLTILYLIAPFDALLAYLPNVSRADASLRELDDLQVSLEATRVPPAPSAAESFEALELAGVSHVYPGEDGDASYMLGPIDLTIRRGEVLFVTGGNGSGKSTLAKILVGLYPPQGGCVRVDGRPVDDLDRYRQYFSAIFSDFCVFDALYGIDAKRGSTKEYLVELHLDHKVRIEDGRLSTTALSQGQRKRLALLTAYLEDRAIYVFDEWAADQDPAFKKVFYTKLLPELKSRGKTVVVISHDDDYFHVGDRRIHLEEGKLA